MNQMKTGPWPVYSEHGDRIAQGLWLVVFGWPVSRVGYYFSLRMVPPYPGNTPPELLFPEAWVVWAVVVALAIVLTFSSIDRREGS